MKSPSRPTLPHSLGGFMLPPHSRCVSSEAVALIGYGLLAAVLVLSGVSGVHVMRNDGLEIFRNFADQVCSSSRSTSKDSGPAIRVVESVACLEKVEGVFSFPDAIKREVRFRTGPSGELILRIKNWNESYWRDAKVSDLAPVEIDLLARRGKAHAAANSFGSGMSTRAMLDQHDRQGIPKFIHASDRVRDRSVTAIIPANFYVTDGIQHSTDSPLFDHVIERENPVGIVAARLARVNQLMKTGAG